jgi:hypothetical protein
VTRSARRPIHLTFGRRSWRLHQHPACGGLGSGDETILTLGIEAKAVVGSSPGSGRPDQRLRIGFEVSPFQRAKTAPSIATPALTYFQSATSSFRARATIVALRNRPPLPATHASNQRARADCDWC